MRSLNEHKEQLNEMSEFRPNDIIEYHVSDMQIPQRGLPEEFYDKPEDEMVVDLILYLELMTPRELKQVKISNASESPNDNSLEFTLTGKFSLFSKFVDELKSFGSYEDAIKAGTIRKV